MFLVCVRAILVTMTIVLLLSERTQLACGQTSRSTSDNFVKRLATIQSDRKTFADGEKVEDLQKGVAAFNWIQAVGKNFTKDAPDILKPSSKLVATYEPLWKGNKFQQALLQKYSDRLKYVPIAVIEKWKPALSKGGDPPKNGQVLFYLVTIDRLYDGKGMKPTEAETMLKRLESLSDAQVAAVAQAVGIDNVRAALEMAQEGWLFKDSAVDTGALDAAMAKLENSVKSKK